MVQHTAILAAAYGNAHDVSEEALVLWRLQARLGEAPNAHGFLTEAQSTR